MEGRAMKLEVASIEHAENVICVRPVWAPLAVAMVVCGMPEGVIRSWAKDGEIRAKKIDKSSPTSLVVYRVDDLLEKVEELSDMKEAVA